MKKLIIAFLFFSFFVTYAQKSGIGVGKWRLHTDLSRANCVEITKERVYCGTDGGLFYIDKSTKEINRVSITEGFSDLSVSALKYSSTYDVLVIAYQSGNIDILKDNQIINIPQIKNTNRTGSKRINHISFVKNFALLSCDFGGVLLDLQRLEIKESYLNIGKNGSILSVFASVIANDSIFLATSQGFLKAKFTNQNLLDFNSWKIITFAGINNVTASGIQAITEKDGIIFVAQNNNGIFSNQSGTWQKIMPISSKIYNLTNLDKKIYGLVDGKILVYNGTTFDSLKSVSTNLPTELKIDTDGSLWHSDYITSIVKFNTQNPERFFPNTPTSSNIFRLKAIENVVFALPNGFDNITNCSLPKFEGLSMLINGLWNVYIPGQNFNPFIPDICDVAYDKTNKKIHFSANCRGVYSYDFDILNPSNEFKNPVITDKTSTGCELQGQARATAVAIDDNSSDLWIANPLESVCIFKKDNTGKCSSYSFINGYRDINGTSISLGSLAYPVQIIIDDYSNKWVRLNPAQGGGILVFNETKGLIENTPLGMFLYSGKSRGDLPSTSVRAMAKDLEGNIWLGTDKGIAVFQNNGDFLPSTNSPASIQTWPKPIDAKFPIVENRPLLFDQIITALDVDGGNRKWIGTSNGLYLVSADGTRTIQFFNSENSPLPSNSITDVKVNRKTGEVLIGTDLGIISYGGDGTIGREDEHDELTIFPNPMKTSYSGMVGIRDMGANAMVKIIDIAGQLVYETRANGGMASWNGRRYNGEKISPGVYIVLSSKDDGEIPVSGKLFVIE